MEEFMSAEGMDSECFVFSLVMLQAKEDLKAGRSHMD